MIELFKDVKSFVFCAHCETTVLQMRNIQSTIDSLNGRLKVILTKAFMEGAFDTAGDIVELIKALDNSNSLKSDF